MQLAEPSPSVSSPIRLENGHCTNLTLDSLWRYVAAVGRRLLLNKKGDSHQKRVKYTVCDELISRPLAF